MGILTDNISKGKCDSHHAITQTLHSESGKFLVDENGQIIRFEPNEIVFTKENTCIRKNHTFTTGFTIHNLIIPEGVKSFASDSFRHFMVTGSLIFPHSLESIGGVGRVHDFMGAQTCVFANCILPKVVIPTNVKELGDFVFGDSYIEELVLPTSIRTIYARQFKDSYIKRLVLPKEYKQMPEGEKYGWLHWPTTQIDEVVYYDANSKTFIF